MVDTLRADYLGAYGFEGEVSPHVDALARESVLFRNAFAQSPWTKPSVASLFTSLYPEVHGLTNHEGKYWGQDTEAGQSGVLAEEAETLAERLRDAGYRTAAFITNPWIMARYGLAQGFEVYDETHTKLKTHASRLFEDARAWLETQVEGTPFFLYLHFMDVHAPYAGSAEDFGALRPSPSVAADHTLTRDELPDTHWSNLEWRPEWATDAMRHKVAYWRTRYASGVRGFDRRLGDLLAYLRERGLLERSVLVLVSDHGEELFEHRDWSHGQNLYDHQLHIPLLIREPHGAAGGRVVDDFVELVDVMPTLLDCVGVPPAPRMQGRDLTALLRGESLPDKKDVVFATATQRTPALHAARTEYYKILYNTKNRGYWLFDLRRDPGEQHNVADLRLEAGRKLLARLLQHLEQSLAGGRLDGGTTAIPEDVRERLESLGYVD